MRNGYTMEKIVLHVMAGEVVDDMRVKACKAALDHFVPVEFVHNDRTFRVDPRDLAAQCIQIGTVTHETRVKGS